MRRAMIVVLTSSSIVLGGSKQRLTVPAMVTIPASTGKFGHCSLPRSRPRRAWPCHQNHRASSLSSSSSSSSTSSSWSRMWMSTSTSSVVDSSNHSSSVSSYPTTTTTTTTIGSTAIGPSIRSSFPEWAYEPRDFFSFEVLHRSRKPGSRARVGRIHTPHGTIDTPGFVAVATNGALKGVDFDTADQDDDGCPGQQLVFCNTYHLLVHPGADVVAEAGGLHAYTGRRRDRPFITDSGGFQVFSLAYGSVAEELASEGKGDELKRQGRRRRQGQGNHTNTNDPTNLVRVTEDGVTFRSYRDGTPIELTPEGTVRAQKAIGADIIVPLDELPPYHIDRSKLEASVARSHRWEERSLREHLTDVRQQAMYAVIHGGTDVALRTHSVDVLTAMPFDGYAVGGSLGKGRDDLAHLLSWLTPQFDATPERAAKPRHLLGIADEPNARVAVASGFDTMDSCYPTRIARHGTLMSSSSKGGLLHLHAGKHKRSFGVPVDDRCTCSTCRRYDRAYLHHLYKTSEPLATSLGALHNLHYMNQLMSDLRKDILQDKV